MPIIPSGSRIVLIEEFTGKGCTNCPKGSRELENLLSFYKDQLVVVSIHANYFADPTAFPHLGPNDFRTDEGEELFDYLGPVFGYPSAVVNRVKFNNSYPHGINVWSGLVAQEVEVEPLVEFTIDPAFNHTTRHLHLNIEGRAKADITDEVRISVMLLESGIVDFQDDAEAGGIVDDYVHNHVLRDMLTPYDGQVIAPSLASAEQFTKEFIYELPVSFVPANCNVIVFISVNSSSGDKTVLQAGEAHITE